MPSVILTHVRSIELFYFQWPWVSDLNYPNQATTPFSTFCIAFHTFVVGWDKGGNAQIAGLDTDRLDNEGLNIGGPDNDGPIVTELPRRSCLLCVCRRSWLLSLFAAQLRRLTVRLAVRLGLRWLMALPIMTLSSRSGSPSCKQCFSILYGPSWDEMLEVETYSCPHSPHECCLAISFLVFRSCV